MFKWYAEFFKMGEKQMTRKALTHLKILTVVSLPIPLLLILHTFGVFAGMSFGTRFAIMSLPLAAFVVVSFSKFVNRFLMPNRYLDEWEIARKQQAMAFSYQCLSYLFMAATILFALGILTGNKVVIDFQPMNSAKMTVVLFGIWNLFLYLVHIYLLLTVKPIDEPIVEDARVPNR